MADFSASSNQAGETFEDAFKRAEGLQEDVNIMEDSDGRFHVIRLHGIEHWSQYYKTVTEYRMVPKVIGRTP